MTVAGDHDCKSRSFRFQIELSEIVEDVDRNTSDFEDLCLRKLVRPRVFVNITANGRDRRDGRERS